MFHNQYCNDTTSLKNLVLALTNKTKEEIEKCCLVHGDGGLLKMLSENLKPLVTVDEMNAAIAKAVAEALAAHTAEQHTGSGTDQPETEV